jgi:hypothetical protein
VRGFIPKDGAIDAVLAAVVDEFSPDEHGVGITGAQHNAFAGADKL